MNIGEISYLIGAFATLCGVLRLMHDETRGNMVWYHYIAGISAAIIWPVIQLCLGLMLLFNYGRSYR